MLVQDYVYNAKLINVVDGDTVDLEIDLGFHVMVKERMRLFGIDTKEMNSKNEEERILAMMAKTYVLNHINQKVTVKSYKQDKYGRFLAEIFVDGDMSKSLNQKLIEAELAVSYMV